LCNDATVQRDEDGSWRADGDPTETALIVAAQRAGLDPQEIRARAPRLDVLPFESQRRLMATVHDGPGGAVGYVKGAVEEVLARCRPADAEAVHRLQAELAGRGLRVLAFARFRPSPGSLAEQVDRGGLTLLGLQAMHDPPRSRPAAPPGST
jgi:cation-transporting P-type ATPase F